MTAQPPPPRTHDQARRWLAEGTAVLLAAVAERTDDELLGPTSLPGWSGRHLLAHLAANAEALRNLVRWARTGQPSPMYASPGQRAADIEAGATRTVPQLRAWVVQAAGQLQADLDGLSEADWDGQVVTAQGRAVTAREIPWMRTREVYVHAVDLGRREFSEFPADVLAALVTDAVAKRSGSTPGPSMLLRAADHPWLWRLEGGGDGNDLGVVASLADLTAYLTGRPGGPVTTDTGGAAPTLGPWL